MYGSNASVGRWRLVVMILTLVLALATVAAGCGGDDEEGGGDTGAAAEDGGGEGSIWVLLPDSATSPRWESDDRRFFEEASRGRRRITTS